VGHQKYNGVRTFLESNESKNTTYQNLWDTENTILRGKLIAVNACLKKAVDLKYHNDKPQIPRKIVISQTQN
jgi:hypothetical protein